LGPVLIIGVSITLLQAARGGYQASFKLQPRSKLRGAAMRLLVASFHLMQPAARLLGRVQHGMGPWNWKGFVRTLPRSTVTSIWCTSWESVESRLTQLNLSLRRSNTAAITGGDFDAWDLSIPGGMFGMIRVLTMVEEHEKGQQLCRFWARPNVPLPALLILLVLATLGGWAILDHAFVAGVVLLLVGGALGFLIYSDCALAMSRWRDTLNQYLRSNNNLHSLDSKEKAFHLAPPKWPPSN
jgi:hypothetical protein